MTPSVSPDASASPPAVVTSALSKRYGDLVAVKHLSLTVRPGEILGFLGPNGAGKSTTIRMLCGLLEPTSGSASVAGFDVATQTLEVKRRVGYLSETPFVYQKLTGNEIKAFAAWLAMLAVALPVCVLLGVAKASPSPRSPG